MKEIMKALGAYDMLKIKKGWDNWQSTSLDMYEYIKIFYWTLMNYFEASRVAGTGLLKKN